MDIRHLQNKLAPIFEEHGVVRASVFGSVSRGEDNQKSDVDLLVKLGKPMGLIGFVGMVNKIEQKLGRKVDLVTEGGVNKFIKPHISSELKTIYEKR